MNKIRINSRRAEPLKDTLHKLMSKIRRLSGVGLSVRTQCTYRMSVTIRDVFLFNDDFVLLGHPKYMLHALQIPSGRIASNQPTASLLTDILPQPRRESS